MTTQLIHDDFHYGDDEHEHYLREGYCFLEPFLTDAGLQWCRENIEGMLSRLEAGRKPEEIYSAHQQERWLWELASQPRILDVVEKQCGPNVVLWSTHCLCKPPQSGRPVPWHQDAPYWNVSGDFPGAVWIALDDIDDDNGAMAVLPRWHTKGQLKIRERGESFFNDEIDPVALPDDIDNLKVPYKIKAGTMATHDTWIPHNSPPNRSDRWRRVIVLRYMPAEGVFGNREYPDYRTGELFPRRFFLMRGNDVQNVGLEHSPF